MATPNTLQQRGRKVLVVDDEESMRDLLRLHLGNDGYEVTVAEDAMVAGRLVLKDKPDLMIVDVEMPYMNGYEFVAAVKSDPQHARHTHCLLDHGRERGGAGHQAASRRLPQQAGLG